MANKETLETIEKSLDSIEETIDTIERIPKVHLNGTTKKQQFIILGVTAIVSAAVAGGVVHFVTKKRLETKYDKIVQDEIEKTKAYYSRLNKTGDFADPESALKTLAPEVDVPKDKEPATSHVESREDYSARVQDMKYRSPLEKPAATEKELIEEVAEKVDQIPEKVKHVFEDKISPDGWVYEAEQSKRDARPLDPYVLHFDEYMQNDGDYAQATLTYFEADDVLIDSDERIINDTDNVVGDDNLTKFGYGSNDPNVVYVHNPSQDISFEIVRSMGSYAQEVAGLQHSDGGYERRRRPRKFRASSDERDS